MSKINLPRIMPEYGRLSDGGSSASAEANFAAVHGIAYLTPARARPFENGIRA